MEVRTMITKDYKDIHRLWTDSCNSKLKEFRYTQKEIEQFLKRNPTTNFVAIVENNIVGTVMCENNGEIGSIYYDIIKEEFKSKGIEEKLLNFVVKALKSEHISKVNLGYDLDDKLEQFWINKGFQVIKN